MGVKTKDVTCNGCGRVYPVHPCLLVACPNCKAKAGSRCKRPSEYEAAEFHAEREREAVIQGHLERECPGNEPEQRRLTAQYWAENPFPGMPEEWTAAARGAVKASAPAAPQGSLF